MQRVLIIETGLLLVAGVKNLLQSETGLEVLGIPSDAGPVLVGEVRRFGADVVVLDETTHLADPIILLALLEEYPELRVLTVSSEANRINIYNKRQVSIEGAADLFNIIRDNHRPT